MKFNAILICLGLVNVGAHASDWYVGAGGGIAAIHGGNDEVITPSAGEEAVLSSAGPAVFGGAHGFSRSTTEAVATLNLAVGYRITPWLAVEADYLQPDRIKTSTTVQYDPADVFVFRNSWESESLGISAIASYPISAQFKVFGGVGMGYTRSRESSVNDVIMNGQASAHPLPDTVEDYWRPQLRAGVEFAVNRQWSIRAGWDRPDGNLRNWQGYNAIQELTLNDFSATAVWSF